MPITTLVKLFIPYLFSASVVFNPHFEIQQMRFVHHDNDLPGFHEIYNNPIPWDDNGILDIIYYDDISIITLSSLHDPVYVGIHPTHTVKNCFPFSNEHLLVTIEIPYKYYLIYLIRFRGITLE